nr:unnamed protein product [Digitaria exilis]
MVSLALENLIGASLAHPELSLRSPPIPIRPELTLLDDGDLGVEVVEVDVEGKALAFLGHSSRARCGIGSSEAEGEIKDEGAIEVAGLGEGALEASQVVRHGLAAVSSAEVGEVGTMGELGAGKRGRRRRGDGGVGGAAARLAGVGAGVGESESERARQAMSQEADGGSPVTGRPKRAKWTAGKASMALRIMRWKRRGSAQSSGELGSQLCSWGFWSARVAAACGEMEMGRRRSVTRRTSRRRSAVAAGTEGERKEPRPSSGRLGSIAATNAPRRRFPRERERR